MCNPKDWIHSPSTSSHRYCQQKQQQSRRYKVRVHCIVTRRRFEESKTENMELKNLQLYLENRNILEENEKLQQKAIRLRLENQALISEYQKKITSCQTGA
ncbi:hypothetical protein KSS87_008536 [Heliosperma pusillum]|nr:hypothetical protein KSS87_008536 [Heliosperma pusillum]